MRTRLVNAGFISLLLLIYPLRTVFAGYYVQDSASVGLAYSGSWGTLTDPPTLFGSYRYTGIAGDWVSWQFYGDRVAYFYSLAYNRGSTIVQIDNIVIDILDASTNHFSGTDVRRQVGKVYGGLNTSLHTIKLINGPAGANGRGYMDLDAFVSDIMSFPEGDYNENATLLVNGTVYYPGGTNGNGWTNIVDPNAFQGSYKITNVTRSGFRINFSGDSIRWFFPRRSDLGKVAVTIDGEDLGIHDPNTEPNITDYYWSGLGSGVHIMTVTNTGQTTSTGTVLAWDRFQVGEQTTYDRVKASSYGDGWAHSRNTFWFGDLSPNDCANFTSQIQYKGGFGMHPSEDWLKNPIDLTQWWNNYPYNASISYSWKTVPDFYTYASNRPEYEIRDNPGYTRRGDLILSLEMRNNAPKGV